MSQDLKWVNSDGVKTQELQSSTDNNPLVFLHRALVFDQFIIAQNEAGSWLLIQHGLAWNLDEYEPRNN